MSMLNLIREGEVYRHVTGTLVQVLNVNESPDKEDSKKVVRGVTFVEKGQEGKQTPNWMAEEDFGRNFFPIRLYPGMKVLMISMGKILGDTELEETEDPNVLRAKHAGELFRIYTTRENKVQLLYCPKESLHIGFTIAEVQAFAAQRQKLISEIQREVRELETALGEIGIVDDIDLDALKESIHRRVERSLKEIGRDEK